MVRRREYAYQREADEKVIPPRGSHDPESSVEPKAHGSPRQDLKIHSHQRHVQFDTEEPAEHTYKERYHRADKVSLAVWPRQPIVGVGAMSDRWHRRRQITVEICHGSERPWRQIKARSPTLHVLKCGERTYEDTRDGRSARPGRLVNIL